MFNSVLFILLMFLNSGIAFATEKAEEAAGSSESLSVLLLDRIPSDTILWVMAIFALLNSLSIGLEKLVKLTATDVDDKMLAYLNKILNLLKKIIEFLTAKTVK